ncbi:hypothetical protein TD95_000519 [Thielaviopsis punctulata]|uniref:DUF676 domain-containing protein n=1 Tax=Thielaviopsis punctulata TaxID=72032 RepID=A0A0F4ZAW9_9PEZI|nr:hypothetical protein TD95_000519 [Thielaviopsis punctulata]
MPSDAGHPVPQETTVFFGSQLGGSVVTSYSYTDSPSKLLLQDAALCLRYISHFPSLFLPLRPWDSGPMDELYPSSKNIKAIVLQSILLIAQCFLVVAVFGIVMFPTWLSVLAIGGFILLNNLICCYLLNGKKNIMWSNPDLMPFKPEHKNEQWIFINGVATGENWLQNSLDRLAVTFGRPVMGIHNRTFGLIFDLIECLIQRSFGYATQDIRLCYSILKKTVYDPDIDKVIIIAHSQGGIVASMVIDWALQELPQDLLFKVEVYTFGSAANHFNSPARAKASIDAQIQCQQALAFNADEDPISRIKRPSTFPVNSSDAVANMRRTISTASGNVPLGAAQDRTIGHIEHYAHTTDYVALFSVLYFATVSQPRDEVPSYMGRVFARTTTVDGGHQFVQHYLDGMFPLTITETGISAAEDSEFMNSDLHVAHEYRVTGSAREIASDESETPDNGVPAPWLPGTNRNVRLMTCGAVKGSKTMKVRDMSRLWQYRNGRKPEH